MSDLTSIEKLKLEKILEMGGGYVLDFSNNTFQAFMLENAKIDIFDQKYNYNSGSKANRLRAFWIKESNLLVGELIDKLLEYWKEKRLIENKIITSQENALFENCKLIAKRLKGVENSSRNNTPSKQKIIEPRRELLKRFDDFAALSSAVEKRNRGNMLELLLQDIFELYAIPTKDRFTRNNGGEQIDGAFILNSWYYIVECKWIEKLSDIRQLDSLYGKLKRSGKQTMGLFLSINGWSDNVIPLLKQNPDKEILLMDGYDLRCILDENVNISLNNLLEKKISHLNFEGEPFYSVFTLLKHNKP